MAISGADLAQLEQLISTIKTKGGEVQAALQALNKAAQDSGHYWTGPKADKYRHEWASLNPAFTKLAHVLQQAAADAQTHHDNIRAATGG